ncbi:peptidoglycan-binding protein, partial [Bacillus salitolerans]
QVQTLQALLKSIGFDNVEVNGKFDKKTEDAVKAFEDSYGYTPDGIAGSKIREKLQATKEYNKLADVVQSEESTWDKVSDALVKMGKMGFDFIIGDDIKTLLDEDASTLDKVIAGLGFVPGGKLVNTGLKLAKIGDKVVLGLKTGKASDKGIDISKLSPLVKTEPNTAFFWSGKSNGIGGAEKALEIAKAKGGTTLEGMIDSKGIIMPKWDINDPSSIKAWQDISSEYANQVSGEVRAVVGNSLRPGNIWENVELPSLMENPNVTKITTIDPETLVEKVIFER